MAERSGWGIGGALSRVQGTGKSGECGSRDRKSRKGGGEGIEEARGSCTETRGYLEKIIFCNAVKGCAEMYLILCMHGELRRSDRGRGWCWAGCMGGELWRVKCVSWGFHHLEIGVDSPLLSFWQPLYVWQEKLLVAVCTFMSHILKASCTYSTWYLC